MFFRKKSTSEDSNVAKKGIKKMDAVVTGVILSGIIASIYGVKKLREKEEHKTHESHQLSSHNELDHNVRKSLIQKFFRR